MTHAFAPFERSAIPVPRAPKEGSPTGGDRPASPRRRRGGGFAATLWRSVAMLALGLLAAGCQLLQNEFFSY
ncbi:MAG: hypothetical protein KDC87_22030 [Planctomycetes bacterium]|nr:hypothetical protein [Planctomycetota bacterium]